MRFAKWHGLGNDYILVNEADIGSEGGGGTNAFDRRTAMLLCDRNFGIGGDGILVLGPSEVADARMLIHNPDGSMAEMCGNGIRMAARFLHTNGIVTSGTMSIETTGGVVHPTVLGDGRVRVDMGTVESEGLEEIALDGGARFTGRFVSVGNPHFVIRQDPREVELEQLGPRIEHHRRFPDRTNVEFYRVESPSHVVMRVWERGVGETLACGSGACAVGLAAVRDAGCTSPVKVSLPGGDLEIAVGDDNRITMTGPAGEIYRGEINPQHLTVPPALSTETTTTNPLQEALT